MLIGKYLGDGHTECSLYYSYNTADLKLNKKLRGGIREKLFLYLKSF